MSKFRSSSLLLISILLLLSFQYVSGEEQRQDSAVEVRNDAFYFDRKDFLHLLGEVKNKSDEFLSIKLSVEFLDSDNNVIATQQTSIPIVLPPSREAPFEIIIFYPVLKENLSTYTFDVNSEPAIERPFMLVISSKQNLTDAKSVYRITGKITNNGAHDATSTRIVGTFYDESRKVIAVSQQIIEEPLEPRSNADFDLLVEGEIVSRIKDYNLIVESNEYAIVPEFTTVFFALFASTLLAILLRMRSVWCRRRMFRFSP